MLTRTSTTHPIQIAQVEPAQGYGLIGITFCPGKQDLFAATGAWQRDLSMDLQSIKQWNPHLIITLMEDMELTSLKVSNLGEAIKEQGILWKHLPIPDYSTPDAVFEKRWISEGKEIRALLKQGKNILIHCKGGLGRAGMISARLLVELGWQPKQAIKTVRSVRKGAIETPSQLALVNNTQKQEV